MDNIQPPTRKGICRWNHQFEQIGCLCKGKSSGRPSVSEGNVRRIQERFESNPRKSTRRANRKLGILQKLSGVCWVSVYSSIESIFLNHPLFTECRWAEYNSAQVNQHTVWGIRKKLSVLLSLFYQWGQNSVQGTFTPCCWALVSLVSVGEGKEVIFLWGWTKLYSRLPWHHVAFRK